MWYYKKNITKPHEIGKKLRANPTLNKTEEITFSETLQSCLLLFAKILDAKNLLEKKH